jgi:hypothetical protein
MSIADKRTCSVAKESLDHADVKVHLQAHVKYAGTKIKAQKNRRARVQTDPMSNEDIETDSVKVSAWQEAVQSWTKESVGSENTTSEFSPGHRSSLLKPSPPRNLRAHVGQIRMRRKSSACSIYVWKVVCREHIAAVFMTDQECRQNG